MAPVNHLCLRNTVKEELSKNTSPGRPSPMFYANATFGARFCETNHKSQGLAVFGEYVKALTIMDSQSHAMSLSIRGSFEVIARQVGGRRNGWTRTKGDCLAIERKLLILRGFFKIYQNLSTIL
ncbi:hypothetical protein YC2023_073573 [Brassica napus]